VGVTDTVYGVPLMTNVSDTICPGGLQLRWLHGRKSSSHTVFDPVDICIPPVSLAQQYLLPFE